MSGETIQSKVVAAPNMLMSVLNADGRLIENPFADDPQVEEPQITPVRPDNGWSGTWD